MDREKPKMLSHSILMNSPNEKIEIYEGEFELSKDSQLLKINGEIYFTWEPHSRIKFSGNVLSDVKDLISLNRAEKIDLIINNVFFAKCYIAKMTVGSAEFPFVSGNVSGNGVLGNSGSDADTVRFLVPNLKDFFGEIVSDGTWQGRNRITLESDIYLVTLDKRRDFNALMENLREQGGFVVTYVGELKKMTNERISYSEVKDWIQCFQTFLTFLNGRRCSPHFLQGVMKDKIEWTDYTHYFVDRFMSVYSWPPKFSVSGLSELWREFSRMWADENDRDFLNTAVHWYAEANQNAGFAEGSIVMTQTALELIFNWLLIEKKGVKVDKRTPAAEKIRMVLSEIGIHHGFPKSCETLAKIGAPDAPEAFVQIRNAIVHSQESKRMKLLATPLSARVEALHLGIWYVELCLLRILGYKGDYTDRTAGNLYQQNSPVPWK